MTPRPVIIAGAGPAGLTAALTLARAGRAVVLLEREAVAGGLARTVERGGNRFDLGGHRFFTRNAEVARLWQELLGPELLVRRRRSRLLFGGHFYDYPLTASSVARGLGPVESLRILASWASARLHPRRPERSLADWVVNRFGERLFETFFRPYTEKVWGLPCEEIGAQWAAQRIKGLSLRAAVADMLRRGAGGQRSLATEFLYPRLGPGMLWDRMRDEVLGRGGRLLLEHRVEQVRPEVAGGVEVVAAGPGGGVTLRGSHLVSTLPVRALAAAWQPALPPAALAAAAGLRHRDFLVVALVLEGADPFPDNWLYLHDPAVRAGRVQNFRAWSPALVAAPDRAVVGMEFFCTAGDALWSASDARLQEVAVEDLGRLGLGPVPRVAEAHVVRVRDAYPVYDEGWQGRVAAVRAALAPFPAVLPAGRNGLHRYDNMDHAMWSGLLAARNVLGADHDLWAAGGGDGYLEPG